MHIVDGTLVKCDYRSDLTKPEVDTAQTCLYTLSLQLTVPVTDVMKLDLKPLDSGSNFRKPKHSRMDFGRICIRGVFF